MKTEPAGRQTQYLASVLALVSTYFAIRASLQLPKFHHLLLNINDGERPFSFGKLILGHSNWFLAFVVVTSIATLLSVWKTFKNHELVYSIGIGLQFFLAERAVSSVLDPVVQMISIMGSQ